MHFLTTGLFLLSLPVSSPRLQAQANDVSQMLTGKGAPLTIKLKDLDHNWRVFSSPSNSYAGMLSGMMGGASADVFTKGDTLTAGGDVFLIIYKPVQGNLATMFTGGAPKPPVVTADTVLRLGLLNLHAVTELEGIREFNLDEELSAGKQANDIFSTMTKATEKPAATEAEPKLLPNKSKAPDFTAHDPKGNSVKLSQYRGHVVVIDFWSTWCGPCQESLPDTNKVAAKYASKGVIVLALNVWDTKSAFDEWLPKHRQFSSLKFAIDTLPQGKDVATALYNVSGIPTQYIIDKKGRIVQSIVGYSGGDAELVNGIKSALAAG